MSDSTRWRASLIYRWLRANYPDHAATVDREIAGHYGASSIAGRWERFLSTFGEFGVVKTRRQQRQIQLELDDGPSQIQGQHQITAYQPDRHRIDDRLALNHPFYFQLPTPFAGFAIGVQWVRGHWFALPLGGGQIAVPVSTGEQNLPLSGGVSLYDHLLIEQSEAGLHRIVFMVLPDDAAQSIAARMTLDSHVALHVLDDAADRIENLPRASWRVMCVNLMFVATDPSGGVL